MGWVLEPGGRVRWPTEGVVRGNSQRTGLMRCLETANGMHSG